VKILSLCVASLATFGTIATAALLNDSSSQRNTPLAYGVPVSFKPAKETPKVKRKVIRKKKKLKNIRQAPRVSPNFAITMDIPLELPEVESLHAQALREEVEIQPPIPSPSNRPPEYPYDARREGIQGRVVVAVLVDEYGFVIKAKIISSSPPKVFDGSVLAALREWKFSPARKKGEPIEQWAEIPFNFVL